MSTAWATVETAVVLAASGALPTLAVVGWRWYVPALAPLAGGVVASSAVAAFLVAGGTFLTWYAVLSAVAAGVVVAAWWRRPGRRPWVAGRRRGLGGGSGGGGSGGIGSGRGGSGGIGSVSASVSASTFAPASAPAAVVVVVGALAWCLSALETPSIGFDARALWLMRAGWFLAPHAQALTDLRIPGVLPGQTAYPPLVSAVAALAWALSGTQSLHLGVAAIAVVDACAVAVAAAGLAECGRRAGSVLVRSGARPGRAVVPVAVGVVVAAAGILVAYGDAEPFATNGYADPLWSFAALGALAFGLQLGTTAPDRATAGLLIVVAGLTKEEGTLVAGMLVVLLTARRLAVRRGEGRSALARTAGWGVAGLAALAAWPVCVRLLRLRHLGTNLTAVGQWWARADESAHVMGAHLEVLPLAAAVAVWGAIGLAGRRRRLGLGNDGWAWATVAGAVLAIGVIYVTDSGPVFWPQGSAHRVTLFAALGAWWVIGAWLVVGAAELAAEGGAARADAGAGADVDAGARAGARPTVPA